jgi:hypothetical protein
MLRAVRSTFRAHTRDLRSPRDGATGPVARAGGLRASSACSQAPGAGRGRSRASPGTLPSSPMTRTLADKEAVEQRQRHRPRLTGERSLVKARPRSVFPARTSSLVNVTPPDPASGPPSVRHRPTSTAPCIGPVPSARPMPLSRSCRPTFCANGSARPPVGEVRGCSSLPYQLTTSAGNH